MGKRKQKQVKKKGCGEKRLHQWNLLSPHPIAAVTTTLARGKEKAKRNLLTSDCSGSSHDRMKRWWEEKEKYSLTEKYPKHGLLLKMQYCRM